jgi:glycosyltransferase involved in cell wall biosynthesis
VLEALTYGTPVIATPCGEAPELIEHDTSGYNAATTTDLAAAVGAVERLDRRLGSAVVGRLALSCKTACSRRPGVG